MFSERIRVDIEQRLVWIFSEMWLTGNRQTRALFAGQKIKISALTSAWMVPKICQAIYRQYTRSNPISSESVYFQQSYSRTREHH